MTDDWLRNRYLELRASTPSFFSDAEVAKTLAREVERVTEDRIRAPQKPNRSGTMAEEAKNCAEYLSRLPVDLTERLEHLTRRLIR